MKKNLMILINCLMKKKKINLCLITFLVILSSLFFIDNCYASTFFDTTDLDNNFIGSFGSTELQKIYDDYPNYDFENTYKYYVILAQHYYRDSINSNKIEILFFNKSPYISNGNITSSNVSYLYLYSGCSNTSCSVDLNNLSFSLTSYNNAQSVWFSYLTSFSNNFIPYMVYNYLSVPKVSSYIFDESINSNAISSVEFNFEINGSIEENLDFNYSFENLLELTDNQFSSPYFSENYLKCDSDNLICGLKVYTSEFEVFQLLDTSISCDVNSFSLGCYDLTSVYNNLYASREHERLEVVNMSNSYVVENYVMSINNDISHNTTSLKFILPLELTSNISVNAYFESNLPFNVIYNYRDTLSEDNYFNTIDLTGKYGALFVPLLDLEIDDNISIRTNFSAVGSFDIQHRDSFDMKNYNILSAYSLNYCNSYLESQNIYPYSCSNYNGVFDFYLMQTFLNQSLMFVNVSYSNNISSLSNITYDTRYYTYYVLNSPHDTIIFTNPNTDDQVAFSLYEFYNFSKDLDENLLSSMLHCFSNPIKFIMDNINNFYTNYMPSVLQNFLYFIFGLTIIIIVIMIFF